MSKVATVREIRTIAHQDTAGQVPNGRLVPLVTVMASPDDVNGTLLELAQKIQALVGDPAQSGGGVIDVGELRIDIDAHRVIVAGQEALLTTLEFKLLVLLVKRRERVQARSTLLSDVWSCSPLSKTRTVDTHVKRLRGKLGSAERFIHTVRGAGYLFSEYPSSRSGPVPGPVVAAAPDRPRRGRALGLPISTGVLRGDEEEHGMGTAIDAVAEQT